MANIISAYSNTGSAPPVFGGTIRIPGLEVSSPMRSPVWSRVWLPALKPKKSRLTYVPRVSYALVTQAGIETLYLGNPDAVITQAGIETLYLGNPLSRTTQAGIEVLYQPNPTARITQAGIEVLVNLGTTFIFYPAKATAGAIAKNAQFGIKGGAIVVAGVVTAGAITVPGPKWSVTIFGALAFAGAIADPLPNPSFDIRPGRRTAGAITVNPWLGAPFNANNAWENATVIPTAQPYDIKGSTAGFTLQAGEPQPTAAATSATGWFTFTPSASGYYQFNLAGSLFPTTIAVYQQNGSGITGLAEVGSNANQGGSQQSNVFVYLTAGTQYWIQIGQQTSTGNTGGVFLLNTQFVSATCQPVQCGGTITANFWEGWGGSGSPTIVGGFGGSPEVARVRCPSNWSSITVLATLDKSNGGSNPWYLCWEIHDVNDHLLGGRGDFFSGGSQGGISSWQDKMSTLPGTTSVQTANYHVGVGGGGDTTFAYWLVFYAFPVPNTLAFLTGSMHIQASFAGVCPLPSNINPNKAKSWAWWA